MRPITSIYKLELGIYTKVLTCYKRLRSCWYRMPFSYPKGWKIDNIKDCKLPLFLTCNPKEKFKVKIKSLYL